ncbi:MAG: dockerin type I repeat-containing protein, partial [Ruminococcus sp.]
YISVYYTNEWLSNSYTTSIYVSNSAASLTVPTEKYDANGDGNISLLDAVATNRMICGQKFCCDTADLNGDGKINIVDLMLMKEYLYNSITK